MHICLIRTSVVNKIQSIHTYIAQYPYHPRKIEQGCIKKYNVHIKSVCMFNGIKKYIHIVAHAVILNIYEPLYVGNVCMCTE